MKDSPVDVDRLIQDALAELGWAVDGQTVAARVRRLNAGLPCEDEFSVVCAWLGRCTLLHKLDQQQVPVTSRSEFQVPDLLAMFSPEQVSSPVLIEVKSCKSKTLSLTPHYLGKLRRYASLLKLPLLIAWKFEGIWTLFEERHLRKTNKNFNISLDRAMKENLLGMLAGDVAYKIGAGAGVHISARKERLLDSSADGATQRWDMVIEDVSFTDYEGAVRRDLPSEVQALFSTWDLEEAQVHDEATVKLSFVAAEEGLLFAHMALVRLLGLELPGGESLNWRHLLRREQVTAHIANFGSALDAALQQKIVYHIFNFRPQSIPSFLSGEARDVVPPTPTV